MIRTLLYPDKDFFFFFFVLGSCAYIFTMRQLSQPNYKENVWDFLMISFILSRSPEK